MSKKGLNNRIQIHPIQTLSQEVKTTEYKYILFKLCQSKMKLQNTATSYPIFVMESERPNTNTSYPTIVTGSKSS